MAIKRIVVKSYNGIGDLLFLTPTLRVIKETYGSDVSVEVNTNYPDLLRNNPFVDVVGVKKEGVFLGYADPIHCKIPTKHHIIADWEIVCKAYDLKTDRPKLQPELYLPLHGVKQNGKVGIQVIHKGHWYKKKVWPYFGQLLASSGIFEALHRVPTVAALVRQIASYKCVVCSEGGISHIAKALGVPAVVIFGGFASPEWSGYEDQTNLCNRLHCSYCYHLGPCVEEPERKCMREISMTQVEEAIEEIL